MLAFLKLWSLTQIIPGAQDDYDSILALQGPLHIFFIKNISYLHSRCFVVSR